MGKNGRGSSASLCAILARNVFKKKLPSLCCAQKNKGVPGAQTGLQAIQAGVSRCHALIHDIEEILLLGSHVVRILIVLSLISYVN